MPIEDDYQRLVPLVRRAAIRLARRVPAGVAVGDIVGAGLLGLTDGLERVNREAPRAAIEDYLWYRIRVAMLDFVTSRDEHERELLLASRRLAQAIADQSRDLGRAPSEDEIAAAMDLPRDGYRRLLRALGHAGPRLRAIELDPIAPNRRQPPVDLVSALTDALATLPEQHQELLALRHQGGASHEEIGAALDLSAARVLELEVEAIHRLRAGLQSG